MGLEENKAAREAAEAIAVLVDEEARLHKDRFAKELVRLLYDLGFLKQQSSTPARPMTDVESKRFGKQLVPYRAFEGRRVDDVPLERLAWYADQTFTDELRRYLKSDRVQREDRE